MSAEDICKIITVAAASIISIIFAWRFIKAMFED